MNELSGRLKQIGELHVEWLDTYKNRFEVFSVSRLGKTFLGRGKGFRYSPKERQYQSWNVVVYDYVSALPCKAFNDVNWKTALAVIPFWSVVGTGEACEIQFLRSEGTSIVMEETEYAR